MNISSNSREMVQQLLEDVDTLDEQFKLGLPQPHKIRAIISPILRRWIVERLFFNAQKLILPNLIEFSFTRSPQSIKQCERGVYEHWMELIELNAMQFSTWLLSKKYSNTNQVPRDSFNNNEKRILLLHKAPKFFEQKIIFLKESFYTRTDIIKMHANLLGGVHLDSKRKNDQIHIDEIKNYCGFEINNTTHQILVGESIVTGRADPKRRPSIYDATELIVMDTARIFVAGIRSSHQYFLNLL